MALPKDRWMPLAEIAALHGRKPASLREIAMAQHGLFSKPRFTQRTLSRWPKFQKDPSGRYGMWESEYRRHMELYW
jgi:hypothetical protein